jgi:hypothetical protein
MIGSSASRIGAELHEAGELLERVAGGIQSRGLDIDAVDRQIKQAGDDRLGVGHGGGSRGDMGEQWLALNLAGAVRRARAGEHELVEVRPRGQVLVNQREAGRE